MSRIDIGFRVEFNEYIRAPQVCVSVLVGGWARAAGARGGSGLGGEGGRRGGREAGGREGGRAGREGGDRHADVAARGGGGGM